MGLGTKIHLNQVAGAAVVVLALATISWEIYSSIRGAASSEALEGKLATVPSTSPSNNPLDVIDHLNPPLPELVAWRKTWEAGLPTSRPSSPLGLQSLNDCIEATDLKAQDELLIGQFALNKGDKQVAAVWFRRGVNDAKVELNAAKQKHSEYTDQDLAELVVRPLLDKGMDDAGRLFWEPRFEDGKVEEVLCKMELALNRDNEWDQRPEWVAVGYGEALVEQSRFDEALAQASKCMENQKTNSHWTDEQRTEVGWLQGNCYVGLKQDTKAVELFEGLAKTYTFAHGELAARMLILAYCRLDKTAEAEVSFQDLVQRFHLDSASAKKFRNVMDRIAKEKKTSTKESSSL